MALTQTAKFTGIPNDKVQQCLYFVHCGDIKQDRQCTHKHNRSVFI